jgi:hypothetical protein
LIEEHLTEEFGDSGSTPALAGDWRQGQGAGRLVENWFFPSDWDADRDLQPSGNIVLKIQPFHSGGFEVVARVLDLPRIGRAMEGGIRRRPLEGEDAETEEKRRNNRAAAADRAKRRVRHLTKNMGATNLVTLTRRETAEKGFWSAEEWAAAWDKCRRSIERATGAKFPYVAVLEKHAKGNYHLHIAWLGRVNLSLFRPIWWACTGGRGQGNIDAQYIKVAHGVARADRVAKYISKYISKGWEEWDRFQKKRYWGSRQTMEEARRYVLRELGTVAALDALRRVCGIELRFGLVGRKRELGIPGLFRFPDVEGFFFSYIPEEHACAPPPF